MPRKRPTPWIHRWSRPLMAGIASLGAVITAYLTITKLTQNPTACPTGGCDIVLSSPYASVFGLPLALFGFLAYVSMIGFAVAPLLFKPSRAVIFAEGTSRQKASSDPLESWTGLFLLVGATAMTVFSGYLMFLLATEIKAVCIYCVASALCSFSLLVLAVIGRNWKDMGQLFFISSLVSLVAVVGTIGVYFNTKNPEVAQARREAASQPGTAPEVTTSSGEAEIALAQHLKQIGAVFYGAWWCPHCNDQKQLFGKEAAQYVPYVECSTADGQGRTAVCEENQVEGYPTWEINGQRLPSGTKSLEELAQASSYQGPRNFINALEE
jgi:uncharacterized membrane protein